jgi:hypothetical protein
MEPSMPIPSLWKIEFPALFDGAGLTSVDPLRVAIASAADDHRAFGAARGVDGSVTDGGGDGEGGVTDGGGDGEGGVDAPSPSWD